MDQPRITDPPTPDVEYRRAIEAVVLVAYDPVPPELLAQLLECPVGEVERHCAELAAQYAAEGRGFELVRVAGGYRYQTHPELAPYVERFVLHDQRVRLSGAALETLAIVAYQQPVTRAEIEAVRGVAVGQGTLDILIEAGWVAPKGRRETPGRPVTWVTTQAFLDHFALASLDDLPRLEELEGASLFNPAPDR
jgi:segregation and condensation protein B